MKLKYIVYLFISLLFLNSCGNDNNDIKEERPKRTVLVYVVESNLGGYITRNIEDMITVATKENLNGGNLIVYYSSKKANSDPFETEAELFEIKEGANGVITRHHIRDYEGESAISPQVMKNVLAEVVSLYPADSYGMVLSSHGSAWMPTDFRNMLRSFGEENSKSMEIDELVAALPDNFFDFLLFDACSMGGIEVVYELRNKADYIISSASEIMGSGFPYKTVLPHLFKTTVDLGGIVDDFHAYYSAYVYPFGNISVVKTSELNEVAAATKDIISIAGGETGMYDLSLSDVQILTYLSRSPSELFDLGDVIDHLTPSAYTNTAFRTALDKAVIYKSTTDRIYCQAVGGNAGIAVNTYSGLSVYPLRRELTELNDWYKRLGWYKAVYE